MKYCFGVDIGGTFVKLGLFTTEGELLDKWQIPTRREDQSSHVLPDIAASVLAKLEEKGLDGINYRNGEPDFSECAEAIVEIDNMTENRHNYEDAEGNEQLGNFAQADIQCAKQWTEEGRVKADGSKTWTERDVKTWRHENQCSWHECCDTKTMQLVSQDIHGSDKFSHSGGCAECRIRDAVDNGGGFDE